MLPPPCQNRVNHSEHSRAPLNGLFEPKKGPCGHLGREDGLFEPKKGPCGLVRREEGLFKEKKAPAGMCAVKTDSYLQKTPILGAEKPRMRSFWCGKNHAGMGAATPYF